MTTNETPAVPGTHIVHRLFKAQDVLGQFTWDLGEDPDYPVLTMRVPVTAEDAEFLRGAQRLFEFVREEQSA